MLEFCRLGMRTLVFSDEVLVHLDGCRQCSRSASETGGQLFARFEKDVIRIVLATGPRKRGGRRTRFSFRPSRRVEEREIHELFAEGLHFVGDWHTHPQARATPSSCDLNSMAECYKSSTHELDAFVMVIVGTSGVPDGLWIGMNTGNEHIELYGNKVKAATKDK